MFRRARTSRATGQRVRTILRAQDQDAARGQGHLETPVSDATESRPGPRPGRPRRGRGLTLAPVALGLVAVLLAGCSGSKDPAPAPPPVTADEGPSPSPTPTPTGPVKPERPAAMDTDDAEGAAAAAEYYIELYPYVMTTGDTSEWEAMSHAECGSCSTLMGDATSMAARKDVLTGGEITATVDDPGYYVRDDQTGIYPFDVRVEQAAMTISDESGAELFSSGPSTDLRRVEMGRYQGSWIVVGIVEVPA
jgi:hypothetical protein